MRLKPAMLLAALALPMAPADAGAQNSKTIQLYVPFAPGGSADGIARILANELSTSLNRQVVVVNQPGAGGTIGLVTTAKAAPDGDTLAIAATGALVINPHLPIAGGGSFDTLKELAPVAKLIDIPIVLVSNARGDLKDMRTVLARAKSLPEGLTYGTTGANSSQHLAVELLKKVTGANFVHVPYRGSAPVVTGVLGDQIPLGSVDLTSAHEQIKAGKLIGLGVPSAQRAKTAPDIPTIAEAGVPGFNGSSGFIGLMAPIATPAEKITEISQAVGVIMAKPDVQAKVALLSVEPAYENQTRFASFLAAESKKWSELLKTLPLQK